jgi:hypothetical protein
MRKTATQIKQAGFEWPRYEAITANVVRSWGRIDLAQTLANLDKGRAFHQRQIDEAYAFRQMARSSGASAADYDDFTDTRDDHFTKLQEHERAIEYINEIVTAFEENRPRKPSPPPPAPPAPAPPPPARAPTPPPPQTITLDTYGVKAVTTRAEYDVDEFVVEVGEDVDFRFKLGWSYCIYVALPAARNDRLRLVLVDCAVMYVEQSVEEDPFVCDLSREWHGELAILRDGDVLTSVAIEITQRSYRFRAEIRSESGTVRVVERAWTNGS